jgi:hypothetical protein
VGTTLIAPQRFAQAGHAAPGAEKKLIYAIETFILEYGAGGNLLDAIDAAFPNAPLRIVVAALQRAVATMSIDCEGNA